MEEFQKAHCWYDIADEIESRNTCELGMGLDEAGIE